MLHTTQTQAPAARHTPLRSALCSTLLAAITALASGNPSTAATAAQTAFTEANRYTVKINASTEYSFIERDPGSWSGAGFLVDRDRRWVLTNAHVAGYVQTNLQANFKNQPSVPLRAIFVDNLLDVAIVELPEGTIPPDTAPARLACDQTPSVGADLGAFGHPLGYAFTATRGIMAGIRFPRAIR